MTTAEGTPRNDSDGAALDFSVTILGSGGPIPNRTRAASGYVVWLDNHPSILVDAGGGIYLRMGQLGLDVAAIGRVLLTHTHIDHTGGLAPFVMGAYTPSTDDPNTAALRRVL